MVVHPKAVEATMNMFARNEPLTDVELDRLSDFLKHCTGGAAMNLEEFDGFFAALIAGPELVPPSEYLPEVLGEAGEFEAIEEANQILRSMMRHWNFIAATLQKGDPYLPILLEDANGVCSGNDWARGFMRGVGMRRAGWAELITDEDHSGSMIPAMVLCHEHDEDPTLQPGLITPEKREEIIAGMVAGLMRAHRYFRTRHAGASVYAARGNPGRVGRNDRCPCGSGKKYKRCCGGVRIH